MASTTSTKPSMVAEWTLPTDKIVIAIVTFLLTTVIGFFLKNVLWKRETKLELFRKRYDEGANLLERLSLSIGSRFFAMQRWEWAVSGRFDKDRIMATEREYFLTVKKWNARFWLYRNKIRLLVGDVQAERFLSYSDDARPNDPASVHYCFVLAHRRILAAKEDQSKIPAAEEAVMRLNHACSAFLEQLTEEFVTRAASLELLDVPRAALKGRSNTIEKY